MAGITLREGSCHGCLSPVIEVFFFPSTGDLDELDCSPEAFFSLVEQFFFDI